MRGFADCLDDMDGNEEEVEEEARGAKWRNLWRFSHTPLLYTSLLPFFFWRLVAHLGIDAPFSGTYGVFMLGWLARSNHVWGLHLEFPRHS